LAGRPTGRQPLRYEQVVSFKASVTLRVLVGHEGEFLQRDLEVHQPIAQVEQGCLDFLQLGLIGLVGKGAGHGNKLLAPGYCDARLGALRGRQAQGLNQPLIACTHARERAIAGVAPSWGRPGGLNFTVRRRWRATGWRKT
jgi:hypothetical protein